MAWENVVWIHPVKRRFRCEVALDGTILTQELTGTQTCQVLVEGATHAEYAAQVAAMIEAGFVDGLDFSAEPVFRHGYERLKVQVTGSRKVAAGDQTDAAGSYTYAPESQRIE